MGASPTIYCLENLTDYFAFERLCHDLMALEGHTNIEPLGGFKDKGRDAIHISRSSGTTVFAYSVREDWRSKLSEDADKIKRHGHALDTLVFISTSRFTAGERDEAVTTIKQEYEWDLELYGLERLRILLDATHPTIKSNHPEIFPPLFFKAGTGISTDTARDHLFISCSPEDGVFADWLTRKLTAQGYRIWCERFKLLGGERYPHDIEDAIGKQAFQFISIYSNAAIENPDILWQRALALSIAKDRPNFFIPVDLGVDATRLDRVSASLVFIPMKENWAKGLERLLEKITSSACPKPLYNGRQIAVETFFERDVLVDTPETLFSNCLEVECVPDVIRRFTTRKEIPEERLESLKLEWAFRKVAPEFYLSFHLPPPAIAKEFLIEPKGGSSWKDVNEIDGIRSSDMASELIKKSLTVKCHEKGLRYCAQTKLQFFPDGLVEKNHLKFTKPDGSKSFVSACGQRKFRRPTDSSEYRYSLCPVFSIARNLAHPFIILIRMRIRLTDSTDELLPDRSARSRRKALCRDWWNNDWLHRMLAICQFLSDSNKIEIGQNSDERIVIQAVPLKFSAPMGIFEAALGKEKFEIPDNQDDDDESGEDQDQNFEGIEITHD